MLTIGESVKMCQQCHQRHGLKIEAFNPPDICVGCNASRAEIEARELGGKFSMFAHWRDGEYQLLCRECDAKYVQQRADLYADTRFGWERKVK